MSRSHSSGHSHSSRSRRVSNISVTETSFQGLHLGETVGSPQLSAPLSAYQGAAEQYRRRSPARPDPTAFYVQAGYDPSTFTRTSPSRGLTESYPTYYPLETANADLPAYPFDPPPSAFVSEPGPAQAEAYGAPDMRYMQSHPQLPVVLMMKKFLRLCSIPHVERLQSAKLLQFPEVFIGARWAHKSIADITR